MLHERQRPLPTGFGFGPPKHRPSRPAPDTGKAKAQADKPLLTIGEVAQAFGVTLRTLRFYEARGLIQPKREGQRRLYRPQDRARLAQIVQAKALGLSLHEIEATLADGDAAQDHPRLPPDQIVTQIAYLERQREEIDTALIRLRAMLASTAS